MLDEEQVKTLSFPIFKYTYFYILIGGRELNTVASDPSTTASRRSRRTHAPIRLFHHRR